MTSTPSTRTNRLLWTAQILLTVVFLFTGISKLVMPTDVLAAQSHLPGLFMKFIAVCEVLGALAMILPGTLHIRPELTPLAAAGLVIILIGATVATAIQMPVALPVPVITGVLAVYVAYGRWRLAPLDGSPRTPAAEVSR
jgi:DoxX-like family